MLGTVRVSCDLCMPDLHFKVQGHLILHGAAINLSALVCGDGSPETVTGLFLTTWLGGESEACSVVQLDAEGRGEVRVPVRDGDVDMLKFALGFTHHPVVQGTKQRVGGRLCSYASGVLDVSALRTMLGGKIACVTTGDDVSALVSRAHPLWLGGAAKPPGEGVHCGLLGDIFSPENGVLLQFENVSTDLNAVDSLQLRSSCLRDIERLVKGLERANAGLKSSLDSSVVSSSNCGNLFYESLFTAGPIVPMSYGFFPVPFKEWTSPLEDSKWVLYTAMQAKFNSGLSWSELRGLSDDHLSMYYVDPLLTRMTCCELSMPYCSDRTLDPNGKVTVDTEDINRTLSASSLVAQGATSAYAPTKGYARKLQGMSTEQLVKAVGMAIDIQAKGGPRKGAALEANDCENLADCIISNCNGFRGFAERHVTPLGVKQELMRTAAGDPNLFGGVTPADIDGVSAVLHRVGGLLRRPVGGGSSKSYSGPVIEANIAVVSAKGPSYTTNASGVHADAGGGGGNGLCGHGTVIMRHVLPSGECVHRALEGTAWLTTVPTPLCRLDKGGALVKIPLTLKDGTVCPMDIATFGTCLGQELYRILGVSPVHRI